MERDIPAEARPLLEEWIAALAAMGDGIHGVYLYGSLALDTWNPAVSDIDAVVLTTGEWSNDEIERLGEIHAGLLKTQPLASRLEAVYIPLGQLEETNSAIPPYPAFRDGQFHPATYGDVNAVTWWTVARHGVRLMGPDPADLPIATTWDDVRAAMRYNLDVYWERRVKMPGGLRFLHDYWVEFGVTTVARILTTLEDGEIMGKDAALDHWRDRLPGKWRRLLEEAQRLRAGGKAPGAYRTRLGRMRDARALIRYVQARCPAEQDQTSGGESAGS